jgi:peptidoglycan hydrolase CwlO-like protein
VLKLIKRSLIVVGALGLAGFLVFGAGLSSYLRTGYKQVKSQIKSSIPIEFEIHRIEDLVEQITPEMKQVQDLVAEEQVSIAALKEEINGLEGTASGKRNEVRIIRTSLDGPDVRVRLGGKLYAREFVETDLGRRLDGLKALSSLISTKNKLLEARQRGLEAACNKLVSIAAERTRLETMVEQLRAELREQQAMQSTCLTVKIDDSKLKQAQELAERVRYRLRVNRQKLENSGVFGTAAESTIDLRPVLETPRDIRAEVDAFFADEGEAVTGATSPKLTKN